MIIVTGAAGFIGSHLIRRLNQAYPDTAILAVDDLTDGHKFKNIADCTLADYLDRADFLDHIRQGKSFPPIEAVFHQGACTNTREWDGRFMMQSNYEYSKAVLHYCLQYQVPLLYASSASVYGGNRACQELRDNERPLNVYAYSKWLFDEYVRHNVWKNSLIRPQRASPVIGLRYFNVYGSGEAHKREMASIVFQWRQQLQAQGLIQLFEGTDGYGHGEQQRDFIHVSDVVSVNLWCLENIQRINDGLYNVGTGQAASFNAVAKALIGHYGKGHIEYIPFPISLQGTYQSFTEANIDRLRKAGYDKAFKSIESGVPESLKVLDNG